MEWKRYYDETEVVPFRAQEAAYTHILNALEPYITQNKLPNNEVFVALGGIHPKVTKPEHFIDFCSKVFTHQVNPIIVEQNSGIFQSITGTNYLPLNAKLENLPIPNGLLSLLICDFTTDFMTDIQIKSLNLTLPQVLDKNGIFIATQEDPSSCSLTKLRNKLKYGINTYQRAPNKLTNQLNNLKLIYQGLSHWGTISVFSQKDSPFGVHKGQPFDLENC